jgi:hypothetical protein
MKNIINLLRSASVILLVLAIAKAQSNDSGQRMTPTEIDALKPIARGLAPRALAESKLAY